MLDATIRFMSGAYDTAVIIPPDPRNECSSFGSRLSLVRLRALLDARAAGSTLAMDP